MAGHRRGSRWGSPARRPRPSRPAAQTCRSVPLLAQPHGGVCRCAGPTGRELRAVARGSVDDARRGAVVGGRMWGMGMEGARGGTDSRAGQPLPLAEVMRRLGGVATRSELTGAGVGRRALDRAVAGAALTRLGRGRYAVPAADAHRAAAHGLTGVLSYASAAVHHGWKVKTVPETGQVIVRRDRRLRDGVPDGVSVRFRDLSSGEARRGPGGQPFRVRPPGVGHRVRPRGPGPGAGGGTGAVGDGRRRDRGSAAGAGGRQLRVPRRSAFAATRHPPLRPAGGLWLDSPTLRVGARHAARAVRALGDLLVGPGAVGGRATASPGPARMVALTRGGRAMWPVAPGANTGPVRNIDGARRR